MIFVNSLRLLGSNWKKALKLFLYYVVIWGLAFALFLPAFFEFKDTVASMYESAGTFATFGGVFTGNLGQYIHNFLHTTVRIAETVFAQNLGIAIYGLIVIFIFLPFLLNVGKYTMHKMLYAYMTSNTEVGFFSALVKGLNKSLPFALCKVFYNLVFWGATLVSIFALGTIEYATFIKHGLPAVIFVLLVLLFTLNEMATLGWIPALNVFDRNIFVCYAKGVKAVKRHFWKTFLLTGIFFMIFWGLVILFGIYTLAVLVPLMTIMLCVYNMTIFFTSQGMRFYVNKTNILTPKKLEEVDNINKTAYIL